MTIKEAHKLLNIETNSDSEGYHATFDKIIEERLMELDPKFMKALKLMYKKSGCARWYA